jgi:hypothetical protein
LDIPLGTYNDGTSRRANTCIPGNIQRQKLLRELGLREPDSKTWRIPSPAYQVSDSHNRRA